jgi:hypothetical protein
MAIVVVPYVTLVCSSTIGMILSLSDMLGEILPPTVTTAEIPHVPLILVDQVATPICLPIRTVEESVLAVRIWRDRLPSLWKDMLLTAYVIHPFRSHEEYCDRVSAHSLPSCTFQLVLLIALLCRSVKFYKETRLLFSGVDAHNRSAQPCQTQVRPTFERKTRPSDSIGGTLLNSSILYFTA